MTIPFWRNDFATKIYELNSITTNMRIKLQTLKDNTWDQNNIEAIEKLIDKLDENHLELCRCNMKSFFKKG